MESLCADPLLYAYQQLGLLLDDGGTIDLLVGAEDLPLVERAAHRDPSSSAATRWSACPTPGAALRGRWRGVLSRRGAFLSVDLGGEPTPDEPRCVFSASTLVALVSEGFECLERREGGEPHSR